MFPYEVSPVILTVVLLTASFPHRIALVSVQGGQRIPNYNFKDCIGLKVKPRKGDALLFWSIYPNGTIDPVRLVYVLSSLVCNVFVLT